MRASGRKDADSERRHELHGLQTTLYSVKSVNPWLLVLEPEIEELVLDIEEA